MPALRSSRTSSQVSRRPSGSMPVVGSSRKSTSGCPTSAIARSSRRRSPPDSCFTRTPARRPESPTCASTSSMGRASLVQPAHIRMVSVTVSSEGKPPSWSITPVRGRTAVRSEYGSNPRTFTWPPLGFASPSSSSTVEVLPAPFVPSSAKISPSRTENETPRTASKPFAYRRLSPSTSIASMSSSLPSVQVAAWCVLSRVRMTNLIRRQGGLHTIAPRGIGPYTGKTNEPRSEDRGSLRLTRRNMNFEL